MSHPSGTDASKSRPSPSPPVIDFAVVSEGQREVIIQHNGKEYRLKTTRNGGLILNR